MNDRPSDHDDRLLVEAAQADTRRFSDLYERNFERVYAFVASRVRDRAAAEDLTAQVFHKALENIGRFEWQGKPFAAWLYRIAANVISSHAVRAARELNLDDADLAVTPSALPEEIEWKARLFRLVNDLPEDQRRVITMRFAAEKSIRETAQALGRSEGAVKQLQMRALRTLRQQMEERHG